jgi:hypothetical protein
MKTALSIPSLSPKMQTATTARTIRRLDATANAILRACAAVIDATLFAAVWLVLMFDRLRHADPFPAGFIESPVRGFRCGWCGSVTAENSEFQLSCCLMSARAAVEEARSKWRGHNPTSTR